MARERDSLWAPETARLSRRALLTAGAGAAGAVALGPLLTDLARRVAAAGAMQPPSAAGQMSMTDLVAAAKKEGTLNVIALPPDWANYGEIMATFTKKYGIKINSASPNASSAEELQAIKALKGQKRCPDVLDLGPSFAIQGKQEQLFAAYKHSQWATVPDSMKDPEGYWVGDYFGVMAFGVNRDVVKTVPQRWADLKKPEFKGKVALNGDPRRAGAAFAGVWSAALANGGSLDDITPGVEFFAELKKLGNFIPVDATPATVQSGQTPLTVDWDYLQIGYSKQFAGKIKWEVALPQDGIFGNYYCQAITAWAPNPFAARLWQEFLYSDEGQILFLKGFAHPARFYDLVRRNVVPKDLMAQLPPPEPYAKVKFPTVEQTKKAQKVVADLWGPKVAGK
jgi:putative spermidine/putrescine transport system substrate-binding protein